MRISKTIMTGIALAGCALAVTARGGVDPNERAGQIVKAVSTSPAGIPFELAAVEIARIGQRQMAERLRISGELQPVSRVVLRAREAGKLIEVNVREGQSVRAGDVMARFETTELEATLLQRQSDRDAAEAELSRAAQALARTEQLAARNVTSAEELDKAKSDVVVKTARVQSLSAQADIVRLMLRNSEVRAPFDGTVTRRFVEAGARVAADGDLLTLVDASLLEAKVLVSTRDIARIAKGQVAELEIDGMGGEIIRSTVERINPVAEEDTRFVAVYLRLANNDGRLWGGMFASGSIVLREKSDALVIPSIALRRDEAGYHVLKVLDGHLRRQTVTPGPRWSGGDLVEIAGGLTGGETILITPLPELQPDVAITINKAG